MPARFVYRKHYGHEARNVVDQSGGAWREQAVVVCPVAVAPQDEGSPAPPVIEPAVVGGDVAQQRRIALLLQNSFGLVPDSLPVFFEPAGPREDRGIKDRGIAEQGVARHVSIQTVEQPPPVTVDDPARQSIDNS
jgi:hypothetical protein